MMNAAMPLFAALDRLKADLDILRPLAPEQEQRVMQKFRLDWNYHSNAIEGNSLTLGETRSLLLHGLTAEGKPLRDHLDIKGHNEAILGLEEVVHDTRPLTEQFIREMHKVLLGEEHYKPAHTPSGQPTRQRIVPGQYKSSTNNVQTATGETFFFATPEETPAKMHDLLTWYRQETETPTLHPVALAAEFHHRFVSIHPFDDGNGRMSRLLMNLILMRHGYPITVIKADEPTRNRYLAALSSADAGDPEPFLRFIIENVEASLRLMIRAAKGESIEEPDDMDKRIALLKKQIQNKEEFGKASWNLLTQTRLYDTTIRYWLEDLGHEFARIDSLFDEVKIRLEVQDTSHRYFEGASGPTLSKALEFATDAFTNTERLISSVKLSFEWRRFLSSAIPFSQGSYLELKFDQYDYNATAAVYEYIDNGFGCKPEQLYQAKYRSSTDAIRIHGINQQLASKVLDLIETKVAEADSSPS
ncbi:Fic family protein [Hymenobacter sp. BT683]|uniref:Fic family protein n=1 Tax=Hymenobacter jeongseonensis TaxID=2791027 RepID=A0ABS0IIR7_9BACT|nr:Fic family protein [Hymenobacter jeongseonensis]MBF9238260.1 Fic family protein [Hymenobacter jeongseonensis]